MLYIFKKQLRTIEHAVFFIKNIVRAIDHNLGNTLVINQSLQNIQPSHGVIDIRDEFSLFRKRQRPSFVISIDNDSYQSAQFLRAHLICMRCFLQYLADESLIQISGKPHDFTSFIILKSTDAGKAARYLANSRLATAPAPVSAAAASA